MNSYQKLKSKLARAERSNKRLHKRALRCDQLEETLDGIDVELKRLGITITPALRSSGIAGGDALTGNEEILQTFGA